MAACDPQASGVLRLRRPRRQPAVEVPLQRV